MLGTFLMTVLYQADVVNCALFFTGQASNPLAANEAAKVTGGAVTLNYPLWLLYALAPAVVSLAVVPYLVYRLTKPTITHTPEATAMARDELAKMGPPSGSEKFMMGVFAAVVLGWVVLGLVYRLDAAVVALAGACVLFLSGVLTWDDAVSEKAAWDVFLWYGGLVQMGSLLNDAQVTTLFANHVAGSLGGLPLWVVFGAILLIYFYAHYAFASITAHILSMYPAFVAVLLAMGAPPWLVTVMLAYFSNLCAGLTHYGTTPAPIVFGTGYVSHGTWWRIGFLMSLVNIAIWLAVGLPWWKLWGLW
jgi:DASS family divalent anion:Na+ symporter